MAEVFLAVEVEGQDLSALVREVVVEESDREADLAVVTLGDSHLVLADVVHEGLAVTIDLGRPDLHALVFRGLVTSVRAHYPTRGEPLVELQAVDTLVRLGLTPRTRRWWNTTVSQVVRDLALDNEFLPGDVAPDEDAVLNEDHPLQQVDETDLAFLHRLALDHDSRLFVEHGRVSDSLNFVATRRLLAAEPVEQALAFNDNVHEFTAAFDVFATQPATRLVTTDPQTGARVEVAEELVAPGAALWTPDAERIARMGEGATAVAALLARSAAKRARLHEAWRRPGRQAGAAARPSSDRSGVLGDQARRLGQTGRGRAAGSVWLRPRRRVRVEGYGGRWSGSWYLARVRHELDLPRQRYTSSFVCTR
jgi:phage protein D